MAALVRWLDRAPAGWDALVAADPSASPSHRPEVWRAFVDAFPGHALHVAAVERDGALVGGAPVLIERRGPFAWLHALPRMLPAPPLALPGEHAVIDALVADAVASLARAHGVAGGSWSAYRPAGPEIAADALACVPGETRWIEAAVIELGGGLDAALARIDRKQRQALRHPRARSLAFAEGAHLVGSAHVLYAAQARAWRAHRPLPLELSRRLAEGAEPAGRTFALADGQGVVSAAFALDGPHETFVWWSGTHAEGRRRGAFAALLWRIVEWAHAHGRARVNLGASTGLEQVAFFKGGLGATAVRYPLRWLDASAAGPAGRAVAWAQALARRGRARGEAA